MEPPRRLVDAGQGPNNLELEQGRLLRMVRGRRAEARGSELPRRPPSGQRFRDRPAEAQVACQDLGKMAPPILKVEDLGKMAPPILKVEDDDCYIPLAHMNMPRIMP